MQEHINQKTIIVTTLSIRPHLKENYVFRFVNNMISGIVVHYNDISICESIVGWKLNHGISCQTKILLSLDSMARPSRCNHFI